jgi:hypothetical protein
LFESKVPATSIILTVSPKVAEVGSVIVCAADVVSIK